MGKINIAIDGFSSCGKSTLAKDMAKELGYVFIDTGAMYRAITLFALRNAIDVSTEDGRSALISQLDEVQIEFQFDTDSKTSSTYLNGELVEEEIRGIEVSQDVSAVSAIKEVRTKMVLMQRAIGRQKGVVMDGRDIGTVVFPEAELKIFVKADPEIRVQRRYREMLQKGLAVDIAIVRKNLEERDHLDTTREESPLRKADDAMVLDNSKLNREEQLQLALGWAHERIN